MRACSKAASGAPQARLNTRACASVVARSRRFVHMEKEDDDRSPPVRHMLATVALGEPGAVEEWMAYQMGRPVLLRASRMATNGSCWKTCSRRVQHWDNNNNNRGDGNVGLVCMDKSMSGGKTSQTLLFQRPNMLFPKQAQPQSSNPSTISQ